MARKVDFGTGRSLFNYALQTVAVCSEFDVRYANESDSTNDAH
jgi:hypothetical protein